MSSFSQPSGHAIRRRFPDLAPLAWEEEGAASALTEDLRLFAIFWLGGVVFFGTFLA
jgi:hypothetical protein